MPCWHPSHMLAVLPVSTQVPVKDTFTTLLRLSCHAAVPACAARRATCKVTACALEAQEAACHGDSPGAFLAAQLSCSRPANDAGGLYSLNLCKPKRFAVLDGCKAMPQSLTCCIPAANLGPCSHLCKVITPMHVAHSKRP